jgi:aspartyl-tRNA(Asn)/glutamyl-tRNA(Gln) amidotransferase subunit B
MNWEVVIGLETHIQLATQSKVFSDAPTNYGSEPNTQANIIDLGFPGVLPVLNETAVALAIRFGLATNSLIHKKSVFARKNYFYPDLPKGYQITQHDKPIMTGGTLTIHPSPHESKRIMITRAHLEEDTGKSLHENFHGKTGLDFNRAGVPLLEIVSAPDMRSAKEAVLYLKALHTLVCYLEICSGNLQEGAFRCDANVSVRPKGSQELGTRTETKNINSFRNTERAIEFEISRQIKLLEAHEKVIQETRLFDALKNETRSMRTKEDVHDYRYFPDPDLLPLQLSDEWIEAISKQLPELPHQKLHRFTSEYQLSVYDASQLTMSREMADYFENVVKNHGIMPKLAANWMLVELQGLLNRDNLALTASPISASMLAELLKRIQDNTISGKMAKTIFEAMWTGEGLADEIISKKGLKQMSDTDAITPLIHQVIANNPNEYAAYRAGKTKLLGFFVGEIMKLSKGSANPQQVNALLKEILDSKF